MTSISSKLATATWGAGSFSLSFRSIKNILLWWIFLGFFYRLLSWTRLIKMRTTSSNTTPTGEATGGRLWGPTSPTGWWWVLIGQYLSQSYLIGHHFSGPLPRDRGARAQLRGEDGRDSVLSRGGWNPFLRKCLVVKCVFSRTFLTVTPTWVQQSLRPQEASSTEQHHSPDHDNSTWQHQWQNAQGSSRSHHVWLLPMGTFSNRWLNSCMVM